MTEITQLGLIVAGILALLVGGAMLVSRIAQFYQTRFELNIWPGVIFLALSFVCGGYAGTAVAGQQELQTAIIVGLFVIAAVLLSLAVLLDIHWAGVGWGLLALLLQAVLAVCFVFVVIVIVFWFVLKRIVTRSKKS